MTLRSIVGAVGALGWLGGAACGSPEPRAADLTAAPPVATPVPGLPGGFGDALGKPVGIEARDLVIQAEGAEVRVNYLSGELLPVGEFVDLESPASFEVRVDALELVIPEQTIQSAMAGGQKAPFKELTVATVGDSLSLVGRGPLGLPFSFRAEPQVSSNGSLILHLERVHVLGIGVRRFIGAFQEPIENTANKRGHLIAIDKDHLVINPFPFAGPPEVHAAFTSFEVRERELVARLGELTPRQDRASNGGLTLSGGAIRTGDMILFDSTIHLVAKDGGPLTVDPDRIDAQVEGGFVKQAADGSATLYLSAP